MAESEVVALGITPGKIEDGREGTLLTYLSRLTDLNSDYIASLYEYAGDDWYVPVGETSRDNVDKYWNTLAGLGGLEMNFYTSRYYFVITSYSIHYTKLYDLYVILCENNYR